LKIVFDLNVGLQDQDRMKLNVRLFTVEKNFQLPLGCKLVFIVQYTEWQKT